MKNVDYNSNELESDQVLAYLTLGYKTPQNEEEEKIVQEIEKNREEGRIYEIEIPFNGI